MSGFVHRLRPALAELEAQGLGFNAHGTASSPSLASARVRPAGFDDDVSVVPGTHDPVELPSVLRGALQD